jgi:hypothetical protein
MRIIFIRDIDTSIWKWSNCFFLVSNFNLDAWYPNPWILYHILWPHETKQYGHGKKNINIYYRVYLISYMEHKYACARRSPTICTVQFQQCTCMQNAGEVVLECNRAKQMKCLCLFHTPTKQKGVVLRALFFVHLNGEMIKAKDWSLILMAKKSWERQFLSEVTMQIRVLPLFHKETRRWTAVVCTMYVRIHTRSHDP